ncbi:hypothetical protein EK904_000868 [Melospiza melodia maxima]|nr:hypothetical protein EK904_000868 [Melospiza melodia maxima]
MQHNRSLSSDLLDNVGSPNVPQSPGRDTVPAVTHGCVHLELRARRGAQPLDTNLQESVVEEDLLTALSPWDS